jgi:hypothetical protein
MTPITTIRQVYGDEKAEILYQLASYAFNPSPLLMPHLHEYF